MNGRYEIMRILDEEPWGIYARAAGDGDMARCMRFIQDRSHLRNHAGNPDASNPYELLSGIALMQCMEMVEEGILESDSSDLARAVGNCTLAGNSALFCRAGRQVVRFDEALTTEFRHTDLDGIRLTDIELPWDSFYLVFSGDDAPGDDDFPIDGCLVTINRLGGRDSEIILIPLIRQSRTEPLWLIPMEIDWDLDIPEAMSRAITEICESRDSLMKEQAYSDNEATSSFAALVVERYSFMGEKKADLVMRLANLVGNALLYLTSRPGDGVIDWQSEAPSDLADRARMGKRKAGQALVRDGYTLVRHIGLPSHEQIQSLGGTVRAHWRRGHWRRQHHGPGNSLIKLVRIRPTLVAGDIGEANATGRIHDISKTA